MSQMRLSSLTNLSFEKKKSQQIETGRRSCRSKRWKEKITLNDEITICVFMNITFINIKLILENTVIIRNFL